MPAMWHPSPIVQHVGGDSKAGLAPSIGRAYTGLYMHAAMRRAINRIEWPVNCQDAIDAGYPLKKNTTCSGGVGQTAQRPRCRCARCWSHQSAGNHPPPPPPPPPLPPIPGPVPDFSVTMQHYGIANSRGGNLDFTTGAFLGSGYEPTNWPTYKETFKTYAQGYINFISKLQNARPSGADESSKPIYVDRIMFSINGNPGPGFSYGGTGIPKGTPYSLLIDPQTGDPLLGGAIGYPMIYEYFVKPVIKKNFDKTSGFNNKVRIGLTFDTSAPWNAFTNTLDSHGRLTRNQSVASNNFPTNNSGLVDKSSVSHNGAINQTFAYIGAINDLILNDPDLETIRNAPENAGKELYWLVTSASYDNEGGNSGNYPYPETTTAQMWNLQVANPLVNSILAVIPPSYSATGDMGYGTDTITSATQGPDRIYQEIYDLDPTEHSCQNVPGQPYPNNPGCCAYDFGNQPGEIGWGVKINQKVPGKEPPQHPYHGRNCPSNTSTPNWKGTNSTATTNSKYYTLATQDHESAPHSVIPLIYDPFGMKNKLDNKDFKLKGDPTDAATEYNGYVLMFSVNSVGYATPGATKGEDMFGALDEHGLPVWSFDMFVNFLGYAAKYLANDSSGPQIKNPLIGIYEYDMIPELWKA